MGDKPEGRNQTPYILLSRTRLGQWEVFHPGNKNFHPVSSLGNDAYGCTCLPIPSPAG